MEPILNSESTILVTGGAGFIGSALVKYLISSTNHRVVNLDKLTYAGDLKSLESIETSERYSFVKGDICDANLVNKILNDYRPQFVLNLAAESHVDRSISGSSEFIQTNIIGTYTLLECVRLYFCESLNEVERVNFRFLQVSTDEVFGDLADGGYFKEDTSYKPSSPYSASKASADHLVQAWYRTYSIPTLISNCSNNYGPFQYPEKLIPLMISNALKGKELPIYGNGQQIRDWLYVDDHVRALYLILSQGEAGQTYNVGGRNEIKNLDLVNMICRLLDREIRIKPGQISSFSELICFVEDRPGHDVRYAIDASKISRELNWEPTESFQSGLEKTVKWYLDNQDWCDYVENKKLDD